VLVVVVVVDKLCVVHFLVFGFKVVEPPELQPLSYMVDIPKVEVPPEVNAQSESQTDAAKSDSKGSLLKKTQEKTEQPPEVKKEVTAAPEVSNTETQKKDVERPPIFVTLQ